MTLYSLVNYIKRIAKTQPAIKNVPDELDIYAALNNPKSEHYATFVVTPISVTETTDFGYYKLVLYYADRLLENEENTLFIQSTAISVLSNVIRTVCNSIDITLPKIKYIPFTQRFNSLCSGAYVEIILEVPLEYVCEELYEP